MALPKADTQINQDQASNSHFPEHVVNLIQSRTSVMSRGQAAVADYIIKNKSTFWLLSIQELAKEAGVSHATVIRFCHALGYDGFSEFSRNVTNTMRSEIAVVNRFSNFSTITEKSDHKPSSMFAQVLNAELESINALASSVTEKDISTCIDMMLQADSIYILGRMSSFPIAQHFESTLSKACNKSFLIPESELQSASFLKKITERSLLFSIAYTRYSTSTLSFTEMAYEKGCSVIAITNSLLSPLVQFSKLKFIAAVEPMSFADLFVAPFTLVTALSLEYSARTKLQTAGSLAEFDEIMVRRKNVMT